MNAEKYRTYLQEREISEDAIEKQMATIGNFGEFLTGIGLEEAAAGKADVELFAKKLIVEGDNTLESFSVLRDYAGWLGHRGLYVALIEVMDCHNALAVLSDEIEKTHGQKVNEQIFSETPPPLGTGEAERCTYTRALTERMSSQFTPEEARDAWFQVQHGIPTEVWHKSDIAEKEKFQQCGDIDAYLDLKRQERDAYLTKLRDEHKLWYTIEINDEVLEFIKRDPEMEVGQREGNRIYITKVPYNVIGYLHETDPKKKRNHVCHCPMLREAIRKDWPISPDVCYCSLGHANHYLAGLGMDIKGQVLESAVRGDTRCRFVFDLPGSDSSNGE